MRVSSRGVEAARQLHHGFHFFPFVNLFQHLLVKTFDTEERALHPFLDPLIEIAQKKIDARLHQPLDLVAREQFDYRFGVLRNVSEILVEDQHVLDSVSDVKADRFFDGFQRNRLWPRRESSSLAERAREATSARGE